MITYANWLLDNGNPTFVEDILWPIIKLDLDYVMNYWNQSTSVELIIIDVSSSHFGIGMLDSTYGKNWTLHLFGPQRCNTGRCVKVWRWRRGLAKLLTRTDTQPKRTIYSVSYRSVVHLCGYFYPDLTYLQTFWNPSGNYITTNTGGGRSGKDSNTVLASIHTFDFEAGCDSATFQPCSDKALANLKAYIDSFRSIYGINQGIGSNAAVAVGRYAEDVYMGGNVRSCPNQVYIVLRS